jgi:hypothetical protein
MSLCRPSPAPAADVWEPPRELQRIDVPVPESTGYTLFFPIELTNKDYLRRVFDIVASGVQGTVKRMIGRHGARLGPIGSQKQKGGKVQYDFNTTCDLYYLAKHIADDASAPVYAQGLPPSHAQSNRCACITSTFHSFPADFKANQRLLVEACETLKNCRNQLMHVNMDSGSLENLNDSFKAGRRLLAFFPPNQALAALASLEQQFEAHKAFKNRRMTALGWQFGPSAAAAVPAALADPQEVLADGRGASKSLQGILEDPLCQHAVQAMNIVSAAAKECDRSTIHENSLGHYAEAKRLQVTFILLEFSFV